MQNLFHNVKQDDAPKVLNLIVEIAKGDFVKYEFNKEYGVLEMDRVLHGPVHYPVAYCDVPQTWNGKDKGGDEDPLDAVVFVSGNIIPGVLVKGKVIGVMYMQDNGESDSKIICVAAKDPRYKHVENIDQLAPYEKKDMETFFETYKYAQTGHGTVKVTGWGSADDAYKLIEDAMKQYQDKFGNN